MEGKYYQEAETIINGENVYIFLGNDDNGELLIKPQSMWNEALGISYHKFSYKNDILSIIGRENEKQRIKDFLNAKEHFKVSAITGRAGNGKSRLVYYTFEDKEIRCDWSVYGLSYEELQYFKYSYICKLIGKEFIKKRILFVIDYVTINAHRIGKWIRQLYINSKNDTRDIYIRILLVERAHVVEDKKPYWYMQLVEENKLDDFKLCNYNEHLQIHNLEDSQLNNVFEEYVQKHKEKYQKIHGKELDFKHCKSVGEEIIGGLEKECKTPLYIMYIADAWINNVNKKGRNWSKEEALKYVIKKEEERLNSLFSRNKVKVAALRKIMIYSMALDGIKLGQKLPSFLHEEFELIREEFGDGSLNLRQLFNEVGKIETGKEIILKSVLPEIVEEFYCLQYLKNVSDNSFFDGVFIEEFVQHAWDTNPRGFTAFLCRIVEDFPDDKLVDFSGILKMPSFHDAESRVLYADLLREYTFWNGKVINWYKIIFKYFEIILDGETCKQMTIDIYEKYSIALLNIVWWCKQEGENEAINECLEEVNKKMKMICSKVSGETICKICVILKNVCKGELEIIC